METIAKLYNMQDNLVELYNEMYGFDPDFGTVSDWNDLGWVTRMYNDLLAEYHSLQIVIHSSNPT